MMATKGRKLLSLLLSTVMVLGMLPAAAFAAGDGDEHTHEEAGYDGGYYYTGVCEYTPGEAVRSEEPDQCSDATNLHAHTADCYAGEEEPSACTEERNTHAHAEECYSVTQADGAWSCERHAFITVTFQDGGGNGLGTARVVLGHPEYSEEAPALADGILGWADADGQPVDDIYALEHDAVLTAIVDEAAAPLGSAQAEGEALTFTLDGAKLYKFDGAAAFFERGSVPVGIEITAKENEPISPADPRVHPTVHDGWEFLYNGSAYYYHNLVPCKVDYFYLKQSGGQTTLWARFYYAGWKDREVNVKNLRLCADWPYSFYDMGSAGVDLSYSVGGGVLKTLGQGERLYLFNNEKALSNAQAVNPHLKIEAFDPDNGIMFFVKAEEGYQPFAGEFEDSDGKQLGIIDLVTENALTGYQAACAEATAQGFTHEFHYASFQSGWNSGHGIRGFQFRTERNETVYYVNYEANAPEGGKPSGGTEGQSGKWSTQVTIRENGFQVPGYAFQGWNTAADGTGTAYRPGDRYNIAGEDLTLYAQWKAVPRETMKAKFFIRMDGTIPMENGDTGYNASLYLPQNSTKPGTPAYEKLMWGEIYGEAVWTKYEGVIENGKINGVKLSEAFRSVADEIAGTPTDAQISAVTAFDPETQAVAWYVIKQAKGDGWHVDGVVYEKNAKYVLQYFPNAGTDTVNGLPGSKLYAEGAQAPVSYGSMSRGGYDFLGWSEDPNATQADYTPGGGAQTVSMDGDKYLYAVWQKKAPATYTVTVNFLKDADGTVLASPYVSKSMTAGEQYNVVQEIPRYLKEQDADVTYVRDHTVDGNDIIGTIKDRNVVIDVFYRVAEFKATVNYLEEGTGAVLAEAYQSAPIASGAPYSVTGQLTPRVEKDGVTYSSFRTDGEAEGFIRDGGVTVNVYYKADRVYNVEYYLETSHGSGVYELSKERTVSGSIAWNGGAVTSGAYAAAISGYTYDEGNENNVKQVAYDDAARTLKLYYKKDAPVDPGSYTVVYTDGTGLDGAGHRYSFTKTVGATYAPLTDNGTTGFEKTGHSFASWQLRGDSVVHGEGDKLYGDKGATIYYDAQWTANAYPLTVTKTYTGHSLPDGFSIAVTDGNGALVEELTLAGAVQGEGSYTWTTAALTFGGTYTFTERDYAVSGYDVAASVRVKDATLDGGSASLTLDSLDLTGGTAVAFRNVYTEQSGGSGGSTPDYFRVTVEYLEAGTEQTLADSYRSARIREGRAYDVTEQAALAIDGYAIDSVEGETSGNLRRNMTVTVWYVAETDIGEEDVPHGDKPEPVVPGDTTNPGGESTGTTTPGDSQDNGGNGGEIEIPDGETPLGGKPDTGTGGDEADGSSGETVIVDGDTPLGNLPQTGTVAQPADPTYTLGMLALMLSMAAAGLTVTIGRKKEEEGE